MLFLGQAAGGTLDAAGVISGLTSTVQSVGAAAFGVVAVTVGLVVAIKLVKRFASRAT